jgi:predicted nucleotidyltransferase component of viral defense system
MNVLDISLVEAVAAELGTSPSLVEKDWHVIRALGVLSKVNHEQLTPIFSGGTSLSKGWQLIERFSEDIDFIITCKEPTTRGMRSNYRQLVLESLTAAGFTLLSEPQISNGNKFFSAKFDYQSQFPQAAGLRPHLKIEMSFDKELSLDSVTRPLQSLIALTTGSDSEIQGFSCVDPVETAADKLSALAWRVLVRDRSRPTDDPTMIRHLHDLAALEEMVNDYSDFSTLLHAKALKDTSRASIVLPPPNERFSDMVRILSTDPLYQIEYDHFVEQVSFATDDKRISFANALAAVTRLVHKYATS